jgi:protein-tyrosine phosphatase
MVPVITHPERNGLLRQRLSEMAAWIDSGARVQITAQSILGHFGRHAQQFCETLLERRMVHFVASDGHDVKRRPPKLDGAYVALKKRFGEAMAETLCVTNPRSALAGEPIATMEMPVAASRKWYEIWR